MGRKLQQTILDPNWTEEQVKNADRKRRNKEAARRCRERKLERASMLTKEVEQQREQIREKEEQLKKIRAKNQQIAALLLKHRHLLTEGEAAIVNNAHMQYVAASSRHEDEASELASPLSIEHIQSPMSDATTYISESGRDDNDMEYSSEDDRVPNSDQSRESSAKPGDQ